MGSQEVGSDHLFAGILVHRTLAVIRTMQALDIDLDQALTQVRNSLHVSSASVDPNKMKLTSDGKLAIDYAHAEAQAQHYRFVGPEHLLIGTARVENSEAFRLFSEHGVSLEKLRAAVEQSQTGLPDDGSPLPISTYVEVWPPPPDIPRTINTDQRNAANQITKSAQLCLKAGWAGYFVYFLLIFIPITGVGRFIPRPVLVDGFRFTGMIVELLAATAIFYALGANRVDPKRRAGRGEISNAFWLAVLVIATYVIAMV